MSKRVSRGWPFSRPPSPTTIWRRARSLTSTTRGQVTETGSRSSALPWARWASTTAASRLWASGDGVVVAGQVEVEVLHRQHLAVAAAGRAALDPEDRPERRLADRADGPLPDRVERHREADRDQRFPLAERRRRDPGHVDVAAVRAVLDALPDAPSIDLGDVPAVRLKLVVEDAERRGDLGDRPQRRSTARCRDSMFARRTRRGSSWKARRPQTRRACAVFRRRPA